MRIIDRKALKNRKRRQTVKNTEYLCARCGTGVDLTVGVRRELPDRIAAPYASIFANRELQLLKREKAEVEQKLGEAHATMERNQALIMKMMTNGIRLVRERDQAMAKLNGAEPQDLLGFVNIPAESYAEAAERMCLAAQEDKED